MMLGSIPPMSDARVVIVIPAFNEAVSVAAVVRGAISAGFESVVVVDDGSTDATAETARMAGALVVRHAVNRGAGAAVQTGLEAAAKLGADAVVTLDADGQHSPAEIGRVLAPVLAGRADLSIGARLIERNRMPAIVRLFNQAANTVTWALCGRWYKDSQSGFRAWSRRAMDRIRIASSGYEFCSEIGREAARHRLAVVEVPVTAIYSRRSAMKGQGYATGLETVFKLMVRSLMR